MPLGLRTTAFDERYYSDEYLFIGATIAVVTVTKYAYVVNTYYAPNIYPKRTKTNIALPVG